MPRSHAAEPSGPSTYVWEDRGMTSSDGLQTNTRRFELYVRISLYVLLAFEPLLVLGGFPQGSRAVPFCVALVLLAANILVCRWALSSIRTRPIRLDRRTVLGLAGWLAISVGSVLVIIVGIDFSQTIGTTLTGVVGSSVAAIAPALRARYVLVAALVGAAVTGALFFVLGVVDGPTAAGVAVGLSLALVGLGYSFWLSGWMLKVVWELDEARRSAAELAIAEERLRIARDLHDLYGRTLATVAVKSELAAELIRRGRVETAAVEIGAVRVIADQSGREMRQLVHGYREADLAAELAGARSLLDSAGIRCVVEGRAPTTLAADGASALAWSLREAVTNVIRHSDARECFVTVTEGREVHLAVTNDGVRAGLTDRPPGAGSGLIGMRERLSAVGGRLEHWSTDGRFGIEAVVPVLQPATSGPNR